MRMDLDETVGDGKGEEMSRGPGYCMREIVRLLENAEGESMTRRELEDALCPRGFRSDNILRAVRTLASMYKVGYLEGRFPETSRITLPQPVANPIPDEEIYRLLGMS